MRKKKKQKTPEVVRCRPKSAAIFLTMKHCSNKLDMLHFEEIEPVTAIFKYTG